jgi:thiol peroxidase
MADIAPTVTLHGNPLATVGGMPEEGSPAPNAELLDNDLNPVRLSAYKGKVVVILTVPSLDTPVCDMETRRFNTEAGRLGSDVAVITASMDLPFAQKRWCGAAGVEHVTTLSDHRTGDLGNAFGVLIPDLRLLARAVFVIDRDGVLRYRELVGEVADEPDYDQALKAVAGLV